MSTVVRHAAPRLPDGTPYVGKLGELAYDPDEDKVQCHLCGGWYSAIGSSHLPRTHGWTLAEYRDAFRLPMQLACCSRDMSQRLRANAVSLVERGDFGKGVGVSIERRAARGSSVANARRTAPGASDRAAPNPQPRDRPDSDRSEVNSQALVALQGLRPRMAGRRWLAQR